MSYTSVAFDHDFATHRSRRPVRKTSPYNFFGAVAVVSLMLACAWTIYSNVFGASVYPVLGGAEFDVPVVKRPLSVATRIPQAVVNEVFAALPDARPAGAAQPTVSAPVSSASTAIPAKQLLSFDQRFAASAPKAIEPKAVEPQVAAAEIAKPPAETARSAASMKPKEAPVRLAALPPAPRPVESKPAKTAGSPLQDMAQRAKAAVMSIASNDRQGMVEKLWGTPQPHRSSLLAYASADASATGSLGPTQNPALGGSQPRYDRATAVYDISARKVYLPDGSQLEAHSGLGEKLDDPRSANIRMRGVTPPHLYDLTPRESLFHGVAALRLKPVGGEEAIFGRSGLLAHTYMLGPGGDSNGCVSFKDYNAFLNAYRNQGIKRLAVVARID